MFESGEQYSNALLPIPVTLKPSIICGIIITASEPVYRVIVASLFATTYEKESIEINGMLFANAYCSA
jgi:hypothetical protein